MKLDEEGSGAVRGEGSSTMVGEVDNLDVVCCDFSQGSSLRGERDDLFLRSILFTVSFLG